MDSSFPFGITNHQLVQPPFRGIQFVRSTFKDGKSYVNKQSSGVLAEEGCTTAAGKEARDFYESIVSMEVSNDCTSTSSEKQQNSKRKGLQSIRKRRNISASKHLRPSGSQRQSERVHTRNVNNFLRHAQEGDVQSLATLLEDGNVDMDVVDGFNWTALMCASYSGQSNAVEFLLEKGALWEHDRDKSGRTALDLAKMAGHIDIVRMLTDHLTPEDQQEQPPETNEDKSFWCEVCKVEFRDSSKREHQSCTVHLFNCKHKPQSTHYYLPESNVGFKMMMKDGWDKEQGLGPDGSGLKFPIKTVLKRDRKGLGAENKDKESAKARITHFEQFDVRAVKKPTQSMGKKMRTSTLNKNTRKKMQNKDRNWERDFRQSFNLEL
ncbi:G patch domain and ankyrin repeat-containing protein 1-like [Acanthaster planci]|uniref:G patch domain and ankyrin repeat-containing protein 1-like n=1 Tax=Acanthaster planci TaxID=133434 RepID=A0A8B7Z9P8_ACAPL|nr:G patch domain and ankyrin repeat-containing protein 1-like [Acanthaster planci]XP_022102393.1 G patch domain and ankyrin repeat-containing protein 1-like [Acanthaster planci]XP_022102394.1 G patch domain and ankyrin repeat-containing protein 1-like [Acanthaster planci]XP_022102395.1 G patch domain and ankyrin repeat-containing protein 1-like [Acanthaster planci]